MPEITSSVGISKPTSLIKPLLLALALFNLSIVAGASYSLYNSKQQFEEQAAIDTRNLSQVLEKSIAGLVDKIDIVLQVCADEISRQTNRKPGEPLKIDDFLKLQQQRVPDLFNLRVTDARGTLIHGSDVTVLPQVNYADRDYFLQLRDQANAGLYIAKPVFGKTTHLWLLTFARRLEQPDGNFAGVVFGTIHLEHFNKLFAVVDVGSKGTIALRDRDLGLIVRYPTLEMKGEGIGSKKLSIPAARALLDKPEQGSYRSDATSLDGNIRTHAYVKLEKYPLYINVGLAEADYLSTWHKEVVATSALALGFLLSSSMLSIVLIRSLRRQQSDAEKLHALFDLSPLGITLVDQHGRFREFNRAFRRICGYSSDELRGLNAQALTPTQYVDQEREQIKVMASQGQYGPYDKEFRRKDGTLVPVRLNGSMIRGSDGQRYIWSIVEDITARKQAEQEIEQYFRLFTTATDLMCIADPQGCFKKVNPAFLTTLGYNEAELLSKPFIDFVHPEDRCSTNIEMAKQQQTGCSINFENRYICKNGTVRILLWHAFFDHEQNLTYATASDITEAKKSEELIWRQANFDPLTELPNRQMVYDRLEQEIKKSDREAKPLALMFIDLDRFKEVNDTLGHEMGDVLLKEAARRMAACVRETDTVGRLGGDEFIILLSELDQPGSVGRVADGILGKLTHPFRLGTELAHISASIGITLYPNDADNIGSLLKNADQAMYAAKRQGRNCYHYYTAAMQQFADRRMRLINDLHIAVAEEQFRLHFQPIIEMTTGEIHKAEALIRWQHPRQGLVGPEGFIALAEEIGMIVEIGNWVFRQAADYTAQLRAAHHADFQTTINMSPFSSAPIETGTFIGSSISNAWACRPAAWWWKSPRVC